MMTPQIVEANARKLVGIRKTMSHVENRTSELWREFIPQISTISSRVGTHRFSLQNFPDNYFLNFDPGTQFEKWAAVEVSENGNLPSGVEALIIPPGLFAVFHYVGSSAEAQKVFQYIYGQWVTSSDYQLDNRPHFEVLGEKYNNNDPSSEEDIWIPVRPRS